jgi:hypothetical protein
LDVIALNRQDPSFEQARKEAIAKREREISQTFGPRPLAGQRYKRIEEEAAERLERRGFGFFLSPEGDKPALFGDLLGLPITLGSDLLFGDEDLHVRQRGFRDAIRGLDPFAALSDIPNLGEMRQRREDEAAGRAALPTQREHDVIMQGISDTLNDILVEERKANENREGTGSAFPAFEVPINIPLGTGPAEE